MTPDDIVIVGVQLKMCTVKMCMHKVSKKLAKAKEMDSGPLGENEKKDTCHCLHPI